MTGSVGLPWRQVKGKRWEVPWLLERQCPVSDGPRLPSACPKAGRTACFHADAIASPHDTVAHHDSPVNVLQHLHDVRLVRPPEKYERPAVVHRRAGQLEHRIAGVHAHGACQSNWVHGVAPVEAEDPSGSAIPDRVCSFPGALYGAADQAGLPLGGRLHHRRGLFRFSYIVRAAGSFRLQRTATDYRVKRLTYKM